MPVTIDQLRAFVRQHALSGDDVAQYAARARDARHWLAMCPGMTIGAPTPSLDAPSPGDIVTCPDVHDAVAEFHEFGHCVVHGAFALDDVHALRRAVLAVQSAGWPLIFAFVYDAFWMMTRTALFDHFARETAGPGYQPSVSFWINHVPAARGGSGFPPHLDDVRPGHASVTCWVPLTPATPDNGCVYVIEKGSADGDVARPITTGGGQVTTGQVTRALANVRALPAMPGSFLAWPHSTIHWGGRYHRGADDRLAISWHLTAADFENIDPALRLALRPELPLPALDDRLRWISHSLLRFRGREAILERFAPVAQHLLGDAAAAATTPTATGTMTDMETM